MLVKFGSAVYVKKKFAASDREELFKGLLKVIQEVPGGY
jgi:hypothetical protein